MNIFDPYKERYIEVNNPSSDCVYLQKLLHKPNFLVLKWFIRTRYNANHHHPKLFYLDELLRKDKPTPLEVHSIIKISKQLVYEWGTTKDKKENENKYK